MTTELLAALPDGCVHDDPCLSSSTRTPVLLVHFTWSNSGENAVATLPVPALVRTSESVVLSSVLVPVRPVSVMEALKPYAADVRSTLVRRVTVMVAAAPDSFVLDETILVRKPGS